MMRMTWQWTGVHRLASIFAVCCALLSTSIVAGATNAPATPTWVTTTGTVVHLTVVAGYNSTNAGFNFDGAAHGQMVVTVPLGDKIDVTFTNKAQGAFHNVVFIPYTMPLPGAGIKPAFTGAASPEPSFRSGGAGGPPRTNAPAVFSFVANKAGTYMMICGVAGHALAGMWDQFVVSSTARAASVSFTGAVASSAPPAMTSPTNTANWISTAGKVVHLTLIAGYNNTNAGFNFNGGAHGQMVVTVPLGDKVDAIFKNAVAVGHDVLIIPYQTPLPSHSVAVAFAGASSNHFGAGGPPRGGTRKPGAFPAPPKPGTPQPFSFVANKAGTYMIICGFPGHALAGMWDTFVVSSTAKVATITFKS